MKKIMGRINGLIRVAEKRMERGSEVDRLVGRQIMRNLKMVKRILGEEIVCCPDCLSFIEIDDLVERGFATELEVEKAREQGNAGMCILDDAGRFARACDYCAWGNRRGPEL